MSQKRSYQKSKADSCDVLVLKDFLPYRLNIVSEQVSHSFARHYQTKFGMTRAEWRTLAILAQEDSALTAKDIIQRSMMHKTKVSRAVSALEQKEWIARTTNEKDKRQNLLRLTDKGAGVYDTLVPVARAFNEHLEKSLSPEQHSQLDILIQHLAKAAKSFEF